MAKAELLPSGVFVMIFFKSIFSVILGILLFYGQVHAYESPKDDPRNFFISIQNSGSENCQLMESTVSRGKLLNSHIPLTLEATGENVEFVVHGKTVELTLKYNCGAQKSFSIYMKQQLKKGHKHTSIDSRMLSAVDVFETHKIDRGIYSCDSGGYPGNVSCYSKAGKINWSITH